MKDAKTPYFLDSSLPDAVREFMESHPFQSPIYLDLMTEYVIENYDQFTGKNFRPFKSSIKKAYEYVMKVDHRDPKTKKRIPPSRESTPDVELVTIHGKNEGTSSANCISDPCAAYNYIKRTELSNSKHKKKTHKVSTPEVKVNTERSKRECTPETSTVNPKSSRKKVPLTPSPSSTRREGFNSEDWCLNFTTNKNKTKPKFENDTFTLDYNGELNDDEFSNSSDLEIIEPNSKAAQAKTPVQKKSLNETSTPTTATQVKRKAQMLVTEDDVERAIIQKHKRRVLLDKLTSSTLEDVSFEDLSGLQSLTKKIFSTLRSLQFAARRPVTALVSGPPGSGKTALITAMAKAAELPVLEVRLGDIVRSSSLNAERKVLEELGSAFSAGPSVLLISQIDQLYRDNSSWKQSERDGITLSLRTIFKNLSSSLAGQQLLVVLESSRVELLDPELMSCFMQHIAIKPPTAADRTLMLQCICSKKRLAPDVDIPLVALKCSGFVAGDLVRLIKEAEKIATERSDRELEPVSLSELAAALRTSAAASSSSDAVPGLLVTQEDLMIAAKVVQPALKREGFPSIPDTTWSDVGGLQTIREELRVKMLDPIRYPDLMAKYNKTSSGILLWGPPGCGKTLLAKAVANEAGINLLIVNGPDLLSMYQGESERAVRVLFARAASVAPCVIFFDEFDAICPRRSKTGNESGSKSTIVNTLLTEMNGFRDRSGVYVMAATNLPDVLDPAVLRPGRFDTLLYVGLPDHDGRVAVFQASTKNGTLPALASDVDLNAIAGQCKNFSGADCRNIVETAVTEAVEELRNWRVTMQDSFEERNTGRSNYSQQDLKTKDSIVSINAPSVLSSVGAGQKQKQNSGLDSRKQESLINTKKKSSRDVMINDSDCLANDLKQNPAVVTLKSFESNSNSCNVTMTDSMVVANGKNGTTKTKESSHTRMEVDPDEFAVTKSCEDDSDSWEDMEYETDEENKKSLPKSDGDSKVTAANKVSSVGQEQPKENYIISDPKDTLTSELTKRTTKNKIETNSLDSITCIKKCELNNPFSEGEYLVYARHFETALKKVKPSVSEKKRQEYEAQRKRSSLLR